MREAMYHQLGLTGEERLSSWEDFLLPRGVKEPISRKGLVQLPDTGEPRAKVWRRKWCLVSTCRARCSQRWWCPSLALPQDNWTGVGGDAGALARQTSLVAPQSPPEPDTPCQQSCVLPSPPCLLTRDLTPVGRMLKWSITLQSFHPLQCPLPASCLWNTLVKEYV